MGLTKQDKSPYGTAEEPLGKHIPTVWDYYYYYSNVLKAFSGLQLEI